MLYIKKAVPSHRDENIRTDLVVPRACLHGRDLSESPDCHQRLHIIYRQRTCNPTVTRPLGGASLSSLAGRTQR